MQHTRMSFGQRFLVVAVLSALSGSRLLAQEVGVNSGMGPPVVPQQEWPEVLTRGPVHEAFAELVDLQMQAPVTAPTHPPADMEESPSSDKPDGDQYVWVPGYWSWDEERTAFVWVSACWRVPPPGLNWVPGYWVEGKSGWDWVSGFWAPSGAPEMEYLPAPPPLEDVPPVAPPPSANSIWVSPCYYWASGQYVLRPGYWLNANPDWVWVPSHHNWTPRGYVFAPGHWDYPLGNRGVLFAPVFFPDRMRARENQAYSPSVIVDLTLLTDSLFACPRYSHYYFGDYYDSAYLQAGIFPWFDCDRRRSWYDPLYQHDRWQHRQQDSRWEERERTEYHLRRDDQNRRPSRTYREQNARVDRMPEPERKKGRVAVAFTDMAAKKESPVRIQKLDADSRHKIERQGEEVRQFTRARNQWESGGVAPPVTGKVSVVRAERPISIPIPIPNKKVGEGKRQQPVVEKPLPVIKPPVPESKPSTPEIKPVVIPPRSVRVTKAERVVIPPSPVVVKAMVPGVDKKQIPVNPEDETGNTAKVESSPAKEKRLHR